MKQLFFTVFLFLILGTSSISAEHYSENPNNEKWLLINSALVMISTEYSLEENVDGKHPFEKFVDPKNEVDPKSRFGMGTGFFISDQYIVTNYHVVKNPDKINLYAYTYPFVIEDVELIGYDELLDIAVLKIKEVKRFDHEILEWAESKPELGNDVFALGHGMGQFWSLTKGIISNLYRPNLETTFIHYYQTDAVINQGNSGGPLLDEHGHVVGVNTQIISPDGYYVGYGHAIPAKLVERVVNQIIETGYHVYPSIGIGMGVIENKELYYELLDNNIESVLEIKSLQPGGAAETFGLLQGDIVTKFNKQDVFLSIDIIEMLWNHMPGDAVEIEIYRNGELKTIELILGEK